MRCPPNKMEEAMLTDTRYQRPQKKPRIMAPQKRKTKMESEIDSVRLRY
jgi:hypothetical protein